MGDDDIHNEGNLFLKFFILCILDHKKRKLVLPQDFKLGRKVYLPRYFKILEYAIECFFVKIYIEIEDILLYYISLIFESIALSANPFLI